MATEEQTAGSLLFVFAGGVNWDRIGQRLSIPDRMVSGLSFKTYRKGAPTGIVTMTIRKTSDDSIVASKLYGSAGGVSSDTDGVWISVTFDTPVYVDEEVRILMEWSGTLGDGSNYLAFFGVADVKVDEYVTRYYGAGNGYSGYSAPTYDATYIYTYVIGDYATLTSQPMTGITTITAIGNANVTDLGGSPVTQHGHCWNTTGTPTTSDSKTENGAKAAIGAFTSSLTELTPVTLYYCRAYSTNSVGTSYGEEVTFTTLLIRIKGNPNIDQRMFQHVERIDR